MKQSTSGASIITVYVRDMKRKDLKKSKNDIAHEIMREYSTSAHHYKSSQTER
jgi:hypothetical protein